MWMPRWESGNEVEELNGMHEIRSSSLVMRKRTMGSTDGIAKLERRVCNRRMRGNRSLG